MRRGKRLGSDKEMAVLSETVANGWTSSSKIWCGRIIIVLLIWGLGIRMRSGFRGATVWPLLGVLLSLLFHWGHLYDWITELLIINGRTKRFPGPWKSRIFTADPAKIEYMLKTRFHNFGKGEIYKETFRDMFGESVLLQDGEAFKRLSVPIAKAFSSPAFRPSVAAALPAVVQKNLLPVFTRAFERAQVIELQGVLHRFACSNAWLFGAGVELDCLKPGEPRVPFLEAFLEATQSVMFRLLMPPFCLKTLRFLNVLSERRFLKARDFVYAFVVQHWDSDRKAAKHEDNAPLADITSSFLRYEEEFYSMKLKTDLLVNLIFAATDTVTAGLTWFFWLVAKNPRVEGEILAELREIVKRRKSTSLEDEEDPFSFSFEEVKRMEYLQAAVNEALHLYPPIPIENVTCKEDDVLPDGTPVEKGAQVMYSNYLSSRMESVWGGDCLEFRPERWMKNDRFAKQSNLNLLAFNGGPRLCTGMDFAYWQMKWAAASVLIRYCIKVDEKHPVLPKYGLVLFMKNGLRTTVHKRIKGDDGEGNE